MRRLSWSMTVATTVLVTLVAVALLKPRALPAERILAAAAQATQRQPGRVEYSLIEHRFENRTGGDYPPAVSYVLEEWRHIGAAMDGYLTTSEHTTARYAAGDTARALSWAYETWSRTCYLDLSAYPTITRDPGTDAEGCLSMDRAVRLFVPSPAAQYAGASPQAWLDRFQQNPQNLQLQTDTFFGATVHSLTEQHGDTTLTLYINPPDHLPVGFVAQTPDYTLTQRVHHYEVVPIEELPFDPFTWPPIPLQSEGFQAVPEATP